MLLRSLLAFTLTSISFFTATTSAVAAASPCGCDVPSVASSIADVAAASSADVPDGVASPDADAAAAGSVDVSGAAGASPDADVAAACSVDVPGAIASPVASPDAFPRADGARLPRMRLDGCVELPPVPQSALTKGEGVSHTVGATLPLCVFGGVWA